jgi:hypothetical protein
MLTHYLEVSKNAKTLHNPRSQGYDPGNVRMELGIRHARTVGREALEAIRVPAIEKLA